MSRTTYDLRDRTVLITGAARGIGAETARRMVAHGANVALVGLEPAELERCATELNASHPGRAAAFEADVTDPAALEAAVAGAVERFGGIDVVVANAGVAPVGSVAAIDPAAFERTIEVNLLGVWRTVRATLPHVVARRGYVLCIASAAAVVHLPLMAHYSASKAGVEAFADSLRAELAASGTRVGTAYFSFIDTDMVRDAFAHPSSQMTRSRRSTPLDRPIPLSAAGDAIERGVLRRASRLWAPRWLPAVLALRGILQPLVDRGSARDATVAEAVRLAEDAARSDTPPAAAQVTERYR